jgi:transcriptional regulator with XRE-family HTH domain
MMRAGKMAVPVAPLIALREIRESLGLSRERMGRLLEVSSRTVERWEESGALPQSSFILGRLAQIRDIVELGLIVYSREGFKHFLTLPMPLFDGHSALQLIELGEGDRVLNALAADYEGLGY